MFLDMNTEIIIVLYRGPLTGSSALCLQSPLCFSSVNVRQTIRASHQGNLPVFPVPELPSSSLSSQ